MDRILAEDWNQADDWDKHWVDLGSTAEAGPAPKYRTRLILNLLAKEGLPGNAQLLDIGSGMGEFAAAFQHRFPEIEVVGIELSKTGVLAAAKKVPTARFYQRDLLQPVAPADIENISATHAVCSEVLEHLDNPEVLLQNAARYMAPQCRLIVTVPGGPMARFYRYIGHRKHYRPQELKELIESSGFVVDRVIAHGFPFFNLFRLMVTMRGDRLIEDISVPVGESPLHVRLGNAIFALLLRLNLGFGGWQLIALARRGGANEGQEQRI
jgi:SAM-dependent methyltransferase